jgi:hypothetical protein
MDTCLTFFADTFSTELFPYLPLFQDLVLSGKGTYIQIAFHGSTSWSDDGRMWNKSRVYARTFRIGTKVYKSKRNWVDDSGETSK